MILKPAGSKRYKDYGVDVKRMYCYRCNNKDKSLFYKFQDRSRHKDIVYCLNCINLGRVDSDTPLNMIDTLRSKDPCVYQLAFTLSEIQQFASRRIVEAIETKHHILLYAVTGAGKTEITFEGIKTARNRGKRVAFVSPRIDVVKEIYLRLTEAFRYSRIDLMYAGVKVEFEHDFTVCTVHQLYNYVHHFDVIIVDEYDAYPLQGNPQLLMAIDRACAQEGVVVVMTATPTKQMLDYVGRENVVTINRRYHGYDLALPNVIYYDVAKRLKKRKHLQKLIHILEKIILDKRRVLIFVPRISMLKELTPVIREKFKNTASVYSGDAERYKKVENMRSEEVDILITTTILERGVTFSSLDVIVLHAEEFKSDSLIQICGRVGRKPSDPVGNIYFLASYNTHDIRKTTQLIKKFNSGAKLI